MTRAAPLPLDLSGRPFSVEEARDHGVSPSRLRAKDIVAPTRGVRATPVATAIIPENETTSARLERLRTELFERAERFAPALTSDQFYSHETGLALVGAPLPFTTAKARDLHISARRPAGQPRRMGAVGHRLQAREAARWTGRGLPIEHPARLWRQVGDSWDLDDLIAAGDFLVCPRRKLVTMDDLRDEVRTAGDRTRGKLTRALTELRVGAETAEETKVRLLLTRGGLPEPELNWTLRSSDGRFVARLDLAYLKYRIGIEHDGRTHAFDEQQFARDADRWDNIRAEGWAPIRILSHHLRPDPAVAFRKVAEALVAAGWRPGES